MEIKIITDKEKWNDPSLPFTQSWEWGEVLIAEGKEVERLAVFEGEEILARAQVIYQDLPFGWKYAFCPKGPVMKQQVASSKQQGTIELLENYLKNKNCIFLRLEPVVKPLATNYLLHTTGDINPRATLILNLEKSEDDIFAAMHPKTRYNIRLAEKKGIVIKEEKDGTLFCSLIKQTAARDGFRPHPDEHYRAIITSPISRQLTAFNGRVPLASAIFTGVSNSFTYLFGASDYEARPFMAPHLLQWEGIKLGKKLGYKNYDFFGVAPRLSKGPADEYNYDPTHRYAGVTRFKLGFGGDYQETPGTFELVIDKNRYLMYQLIKKAMSFLKSS